MEILLKEQVDLFSLKMNDEVLDIRYHNGQTFIYYVIETSSSEWVSRNHVLVEYLIYVI